MPVPATDPPSHTIVRVDDEEGLDAVLEIDAESFISPWTRDMYRRELERGATCHLYVLRTADGPVAAYCAFWMVTDDVHINNVATRQRYRRRGFGAALVRHALAVGRSQGARRATLEVRTSNAPARALYERLGFRTTSVRRGYYTRPVEDALVLWRDDL